MKIAFRFVALFRSAAFMKALRMGRGTMPFLGLLLTAGISAKAADVLTQHNDVARTGANLQETDLTPASVAARFGKLFSRPVDGQLYAQPLVVSKVEMPGKGVRDVVYLATMKNNVYAFDASNPDEELPLWKTSLGRPVPYKLIPFNWGSAFGKYNIEPFIGITSTPVIDPVSRGMYVAVKSMESGERIEYHLYCLDITTGAVKAKSSVIQSGVGKDKLQARTALQRPGLLLANGMVYLGFGSHQDGGDYHGWVVAFDAATLEQKHAFCTTPDDEDGEGGVWQAGNGLAADPQGNIYIMTGNGAFSPNHQYGTCFVKLSPELKVLDWFTPWNYEKLTRDDIDLGSSGPVLLPDSGQLVGGGKAGWLYLLDYNHMGKLQPRHSVPPALQVFRVTDHWSLTWLSWLIPVFGYHHIHGGPVYWKSAEQGPLLYIWPEETKLKAYRFDPVRHFKTKPVATGPRAPAGMPGGCLSLSANGDQEGLLWTTTPLRDDAFVKVVRGSFRVFDANTLKLLWASEEKTPEDSFNFAKYCAPTAANGRVYLATFSDRLNVYGLLPEQPNLPDWTQTGKPPKKGKGHGRMKM
jgi:outer membrane protein assembly factor BamB